MSESKRPPSSEAKEKKNDDEEKNEKEVAQEQIPLDPRIEWFSERVIAGLRVKSEKWKKMTLVKEST